MRLKDKFWGRVLAALSVSGLLGGTIGYEITKHRLDDAVSTYVQTEDFKKRLPQLIAERVPQIDQQLKELEQREQALDIALNERRKVAESLSTTLFAIEPNHLALTAADGRVFRIDAGTLSQRLGPCAVTFQKPFSAPPVVLITPAGCPTRITAAVDEVSATGFHTNACEFHRAVYWLALGQ